MKTNEGMIDRVARFFAAVCFLFLAFAEFDVMSGSIWGIVCAAVGGTLLVTGILGYCPAYGLCKLSTCKAA